MGAVIASQHIRADSCASQCRTPRGTEAGLTAIDDHTPTFSSGTPKSCTIWLMYGNMTLKMRPSDSRATISGIIFIYGRGVSPLGLSRCRPSWLPIFSKYAVWG